MTGARLQLRPGSEAETMRLGARLAEAAKPEPSRALRVLLHGELGAGKTTLARGFLMALGAAGPIRSPSYALLEHYALADWQAVHVDLYRIEQGAELLSLGLEDFDRAGTVWLIEWPERAPQQLGAADLSIDLRALQTLHEVSIAAVTPSGERWLRKAFAKELEAETANT